jgi:CBS domain-containing protein/anti-sigma regulatory factor (Ser/Thr protein kinase)
MNADITKIQEIFYELRVHEVMTTDVLTVTPQTSMKELEEIMRVHRISGTPVVENGQLVGIVSIQDLINALSACQIEQSVSDWMTHEVEALHPYERVISAIKKLHHTDYGRFPVVDDATGKLAGILTQGDIIKGTLKQLDVDYRRREQQSLAIRHFFSEVLSEETSIVLRYTVKARDVEHGGEASSQFKRSLGKLGVPPQVLRRIAIATYEAEMNLVLHTTHGGQIQADIRPGRICIDVHDQGPGIPDVERAMQPGFSTASEWIRELGFGAGMGLANIKNCADEMSLESEMDQGTHLRILFQSDEVLVHGQA